MFSRRDNHPAGGRFGARRLFTTLAAWLVLAVAVPAEADAPPQIVIGRQGGAYTVTARFEVPHLPGHVLNVLTDYAGIPEFVPDITRSVVRSRQGARSVVEQDAVSRVMLFSKTVHLRLAIDESPDALTFRDLLGTSFTRYEGRWQLVPVDAGTLVTYELIAQPSFSVPGFLIRRLLARDADEMIDRLRDEMHARAGASR